MQISESLVTFGIAETSRDILVGIFDDKSGSRMTALAKKIDGRPIPLDELPYLVNYDLIKKVTFMKISPLFMLLMCVETQILHIIDS